MISSSGNLRRRPIGPAEQGKRSLPQVDRQEPPTKRRIAISLFSGAGGLDLGVEGAGYSVLAAVEIDPVSVQTLNRNRARWFPSLLEVRPLDITKLVPEDFMQEGGIAPGECDLLIGGPPCVAFSKSGFHLEYKRKGKDPRAGLLYDYLRFLDGLRPRAYILENVYGLAYRNQSATFFESLRAGIEELGYSFRPGVLNAADYGVPQNRQRLFVIGARDGQALEFPEPTYWGHLERRKPPPNVHRLLPHVTAGEALNRLKTSPELEEQIDGKYGHLLPEIPPGGNYLFFTAHEGHKQPLFEWRSRYWTFLLKLDPNRPSPTIQAQPGPYVGPFHWENRRLRVPELKRLHGFPLAYDFAGTRREIQRQIGNAVPPRLAKIVARAIKKQTDGASAIPLSGWQVRHGVQQPP
jgi:DNA (cytosine-5)-methyltransferase 1